MLTKWLWCVATTTTSAVFKYLHSMYLNFGWVASFVTKDTNSIVCGRSTTALYKSFSLRNVWTMLSTGVTLLFANLSRDREETKKYLFICYA